MREIVASVTSRGQVTIPATVRRHLGVETPDKITFVISDDGSVTLEKPVIVTMASLRGVIPPLPNTSEDFEKEIEEAMEEAAEHRMAKMRRQ